MIDVQINYDARYGVKSNAVLPSNIEIPVPGVGSPKKEIAYQKPACSSYEIAAAVGVLDAIGWFVVVLGSTRDDVLDAEHLLVSEANVRVFSTCGKSIRED